MDEAGQARATRCPQRPRARQAWPARDGRANKATVMGLHSPISALAQRGKHVDTIDAGATPATESALFVLVYRELRRIARSQRRAVGSPATLDTTALVHEVYLKLHGAKEAQAYDRVHFLSLATRAMRQILVDHARARSRAKRGGAQSITSLNEDVAIAANTGEMVDIVALDEALTHLAQIDQRAGQLVEWRVFGGMEMADIALLQGITERTVFRDWRRARAFLVDRLGFEHPRD